MNMSIHRVQGVSIKQKFVSDFYTTDIEAVDDKGNYFVITLFSAYPLKVKQDE